MTETSNQMEKELDQLRALRDEVRLKVHLAKMETKDRWNELEPRVSSLIDQTEKSTAAMSRSLVTDAIGALEQLRDSI